MFVDIPTAVTGRTRSWLGPAREYNGDARHLSSCGRYVSVKQSGCMGHMVQSSHFLCAAYRLARSSSAEEMVVAPSISFLYNRHT